MIDRSITDHDIEVRVRTGTLKCATAFHETEYTRLQIEFFGNPCLRGMLAI